MEVGQKDDVEEEELLIGASGVIFAVEPVVVRPPDGVVLPVVVVVPVDVVGVVLVAGVVGAGVDP